MLTVMLTSPGVNWTYLTTSPAATCTACTFYSITIKSITWSGTQFVAVALSGAIFTSPDGITWTTRLAGVSYGVTSYGSLMSVSWSPSLSRYVAVGVGNIMTSSDGITWTPNTSGAISTSFLYRVIWSGTQFIAVGNAGIITSGGLSLTSANAILTSPDGLTWTPQTSGIPGNLLGVAWSGTRYVAVGDVTLMSTDGINWSKVADNTTGWTSIVWSGAQFAEVGSSGSIRTSPDGITWTSQSSQPASLYGVAWTGVQFVAVGGSGGSAFYGFPGVGGTPGYIATSPDGITWTSRTIGVVGTTYNTSYSLFDAAWNGSKLVVVGEGTSTYFIYTSP